MASAYKIKVRHFSPRANKGDKELSEVAGTLSIVGRLGSVPAGSFQLNHINQIILSPASAVTPGAASQRGIAGSVQTPDGAYRNSVAIRPFYSGTTGTRSVSGIGAIGSTAAIGTTTAQFHAYGY